MFHPACPSVRFLVHFFQYHIEIHRPLVLDRTYSGLAFLPVSLVSLSSLHPLYLERAAWFSLARGHHFAAETTLLSFQNALRRERMMPVCSSGRGAWSS